MCKVDIEQVHEFFVSERAQDMENEMFQYIAEGNAEEVEAFLKREENRHVETRLTEDLRLARGEFCALVALISRIAVQNGLSSRESKGANLYFLKCMERAVNGEQVVELQRQMICWFTNEIARLNDGKKNSRMMRGVKAYIRSHIWEKLTLEEIAKAFGISKNYLSMYFREEFGITVYTYIQEEKIKRAKELLDTNKYSLIEISERLSFSSQSHFTNVFRKVAGITPKQYRDRQSSFHTELLPLL